MYLNKLPQYFHFLLIGSIIKLQITYFFAVISSKILKYKTRLNLSYASSRTNTKIIYYFNNSQPESLPQNKININSPQKTSKVAENNIPLPIARQKYRIIQQMYGNVDSESQIGEQKIFLSNNVGLEQKQYLTFDELQTWNEQESNQNQCKASLNTYTWKGDLQTHHNCSDVTLCPVHGEVQLQLEMLLRKKDTIQVRRINLEGQDICAPRYTVTHTGTNLCLRVLLPVDPKTPSIWKQLYLPVPNSRPILNLRQTSHSLQLDLNGVEVALDLSSFCHSSHFVITGPATGIKVMQLPTNIEASKCDNNNCNVF